VSHPRRLEFSGLMFLMTEMWHVSYTLVLSHDAAGNPRWFWCIYWLWNATL